MVQPLEFVHHDDWGHLPGSGHRGAAKRTKYTAQAWYCRSNSAIAASADRSAISQACKRKKVKCSGGDPCRNCQSRGILCSYGAEDDYASLHVYGSDGPKATTVVKTAYKHSEHSKSREPPRRVRTSSRLVPAVVDSRLDGLSDRVKALERKVNHLLEAPNDSDDEESLPSVLHPVDQEDNVFTLSTSPTEDMSLSSHVAAMRALLSRPASPQSKDVVTKQHVRLEMLINLPEPPKLQHLLQVYFNEMECYYPFLDRDEVEPRIYRCVRDLGYNSSCCTVLVSLDRLSLLALVCLMLALAECLDSQEGAQDKEARPGWNMYLQGCRAARRTFHAKIIDLDTVRAQILTAAYLMQLELLLAASHSISVASQLAASLRLNNENTWLKTSPTDVLMRKRLWWTIFVIDRRIAQKCGAAFHIQESEFCMSDFKDDAPSTDCAYLQVHINIARLWGHIWNSLFAVGAITKSRDEIWLTVEVMDTQILNACRQIPPELRWDPNKFTDGAVSAPSLQHLRRCLYLYTRLELLRMLIRQNLLRPGPFSPETAHHCARLAREVINALCTFVGRYPFKRAFGYFCTASTVECAYHLVPVLRYSTDEAERAASMTSLQLARKILEQLEPKLNMAKKSLRALHSVLTRWGSESAVSNQLGSATQVFETNGEGQLGRELESSRADFDLQADFLDELNPQAWLNPDEWLNLPMGAVFGGDFDFHAGP